MGAGNWSLLTRNHTRSLLLAAVHAVELVVVTLVNVELVVVVELIDLELVVVVLVGVETMSFTTAIPRGVLSPPSFFA